MGALFQDHAAAGLCAIKVQASATDTCAAGDEKLLEVVTTPLVPADLTHEVGGGIVGLAVKRIAAEPPAPGQAA